MAFDTVWARIIWLPLSSPSSPLDPRDIITPITIWDQDNIVSHHFRPFESIIIWDWYKTYWHTLWTFHVVYVPLLRPFLLKLHVVLRLATRWHSVVTELRFRWHHLFIVCSTYRYCPLTVRLWKLLPCAFRFLQQEMIELNYLNCNVDFSMFFLTFFEKPENHVSSQRNTRSFFISFFVWTDFLILLCGTKSLFNSSIVLFVWTTFH